MLTQDELFPSLSVPEQQVKPSDPLWKPFRGKVELQDDCFSIRIPLEPLRKMMAAPFENLVAQLRHLGRYQVRRSVNKGQKMLTLTLPLDRFEGPFGNDFLLLPKAQANSAICLLQTAGFDVQRPPARKLLSWPGSDEELQAALCQPFNDGSTLDSLQIETVRKIIQADRSGIVEYSMGGGKTRLIAAIAKLFPTIRPILITGAAVTDTANLAVTIAQFTGEPVALLGCAGGLHRKAFKGLITTNWQKASIIVGTHALLKNVPPIADALLAEHIDGDTQDTAMLPEMKPSAGTTESDLGSFLANGIKLYIADEVDAMPTVRNLAHLRAMHPQMLLGFSGTWLKRSDHCDYALGDLLCYNGAGDLLAAASYSDTVRVGRATPVEIHSYEFREDEFPHRINDGHRRFNLTLVEQKITQHDGRNRFAALLLRHLMDISERERRGTILSYSKTIDHARTILRHLGAIMGFAPTPAELARRGILLHNAQLKHDSRISNIHDIIAGQARLVLTTDTLAIGFDADTVSDIVDLTGRKEIRASIQRSGRPLRRKDGKFVARIHIVRDTHHPAFAKISGAKIGQLEYKFEARATVHKASEFCGSQATASELDALISDELNRK